MITGKNAELYFGESVYKQMNIEVVGTGIVIDNSMREQDTFTLTETLCDSSELKFGSCLPNQISFVGREIPASIKGKRLHPVEILEGNEDDPFEYGTYTVYSDVPTSDRTKRQITAYDAMYDIINADVKSWYAGLTFPMTLKAFRDSFFAHLGIAQKETTLVNDEMTVNKTLIATQTDSESTITEESSISGKTVIEAICEINGVFGNINHDGEFEYVELKEIVSPLYPANDLYPSDDLFPRDPNTISMTGHYITFDYEDFRSKAITQLEIRPSDDSTGVIVGTSGNNYVISGNFLVSDKTGAELEAIAENTLSVIKKAAYIPIKSSEIVGNPCIELGDSIRFNTTREIVESYVLQRTLTGIQSKRDSITASGTETHSANVNSIKDTISNLSGRTNKLERTADHTLSVIKAVDSKVNELDSSVKESVSELDSKIEQTASSITTEVSQKVTEINNSISTVDGKVNNVDGKVDDLSSTVTTSVSELNSKIEQTASSITSEVNKKVTKIDGDIASVDGKVDDLSQSVAASETELSSKIEQTAEQIQTEVSNRQNADNEMLTKVSQTAHSIALVASGGDNSVGITIQLYDENGNLIDTDSGNANINIVGFVTFSDLAGNETTTINGANITTGIISADRIDTENFVAKNGNFTKSFNVEIPISGSKNFVIRAQSDELCFIGREVYDSGLGGNVLYGIYFKGNKAYYAGNSGYGEIATKNDIPDMSDYLKQNASGKFNADYASSAGGLSGQPSVNLNNCKASDFYFIGSPSAGSSLLPIGYNSKTYHFGHYTGSSERFKNRISDVEEPALDPHRLYDTKICQYKYNTDYLSNPCDCRYNRFVIGFIAEDLETVYPVAVDKDDNGVIMDWNYKYVIPPMLALIQEQHKDIESLKQENLALQNRLSILEQKMEVLENAYNNKNN